MSAALSILTVWRDLYAADFFPLPTWRPWFVVTAVTYGLADQLTDADRAFARELLGGRSLPATSAHQAIWLFGRRAGKTLQAAFRLVYHACFVRHRLIAGERAVAIIVTPDRRQARVAFRYVQALIAHVPMLAALVRHTTKDRIELSTGIDIEVHTSNFRTIRGYTVCYAVIDEACFLPTDDSAIPDDELVAALRPAMVGQPDARLDLVSSPYARRGAVWNNYRKYFGQDDAPVLVWQGSTEHMRPDIDRAFIAQEYADDPAKASAEYGAEWRRDVESFLSSEQLDDVIVTGRPSLPPMPDVEYSAFVDPAGGSGKDSFTCAIAHERDGIVMLDRLDEVRPPFSPEVAIRDLAAILSTYGVRRVVGDRWAGEFPREGFRKLGIGYDVSDRTKSDLYLDALSLITSRRCELVDDPRLKKQLEGLERRTGRSGRDVIDHPPHGHDDAANAAAGVLVQAGILRHGHGGRMVRVEGL